ncbi:MAG: NAD(P)H-dependent oxidoreductase [Nitrososphaerota archaeon]|nr:NAD(P)H-dependent oxidoreductase [Candidatus Bathyarchaeota archaeon]MDW8048213.1 NAD(P)H-dependent oxidoreductase [Nitrososphaerota archaeon]
MARILIIYDSRTGNTEKIAHLIDDGLRSVKGIESMVKRVDECSLQDVLEADGIIIGSPTYYGNMSGKIKAFLDKTVEIHGRLEGKTGAAFTSSGGTASGAETTLLSILESLLIHGMIVKGDPDDQHYGLAVVGAPRGREEKRCRDFGVKFAKLVTRLTG